MKKKKMVCFLLAIAMTASFAAGCGDKNNGSGSYTDNGGKITYPVQTDDTLSFFYYASATQTPRNEAPIWQEAEKRTGIKMEWIRVQSSDQLSLMFASGSIPDIIDEGWIQQPGGARSFANQGYILELTDLIDNYMPNFRAFLDSKEEYDYQTKSDDGKYYFVPWYRERDELLHYYGPIIRKDLLEQVNQEVPVTVDDWYNVLTAFKNELGMETPLTMELSHLNMFFSGAYGLASEPMGYNDFRIDESGNVVYGPIEPMAKEAYQTMAKWYKEGLIDQNIFAIDGAAVASKMTTGMAGASYGLLGGGIGGWQKNHDESIEGFDLIGVTPPVVNRGDTPILGQTDFYQNGIGQAISASCKNPELAARWLDYFFSEEGIRLYNYGIEGVSYDMVDGAPVVKPEIIASQNRIDYLNAAGGLGVQLWDSYRQNQILYPEKQEAAVAAWGATNAAQTKLPNINHTDEETAEISPLINDITTYKNETVAKFILGTEDIDAGFDKYVAQIKAFGIDKVLAMKQEALKRYQTK